MKAILALEDGTIFTGESFGATGERFGEVVFNTSMSGYQEVITDPSYKGQIVAMTYPLIGNYGVNDEDVESRRPFLEGFAVKEYSKVSSNWRAQQSLGDYLAKHKVMGIEGVDTRALTLHIRQAGAMKAVLSTLDPDEKSLVKKARDSAGLVGVDLVREVSVNTKYVWAEPQDARAPKAKKPLRVAILDCGIKYSSLRELARRGCAVTVYPAQTPAQEIINDRPDGMLLSNGPGDPAAVTYVITTVRQLLGRFPMFGICLGQQMLGLALGGRTFKLKFGHHGGNQPVKDLKSGKVSISVQNHGFCVDIDSLSRKEVEITHINLNDKTLEGIRHRKLPVFSVQFHPEAGPGPHDCTYMFDEFVAMMKKRK
jgi:carbamoyl-phosphate synthase small subunit